MGYFFLTHVFYEEGVGQEVNEPIFDLPKKEVELLAIGENSIDEVE